MCNAMLFSMLVNLESHQETDLSNTLCSIRLDYAFQRMTKHTDQI